jgi:hexosaminidase
MKIKILLLLNFVSVMCQAQQKVSIIPQPVSLQLNAGFFTIDNNTSISFRNTKELNAMAIFLANAIKNVSGYTLPFKPMEKKSIQLLITKMGDINDEGYKLKVTPSSIIIKANSKAGIMYGIQSLLQILPAIRTNATLMIPCMSITDYPRFKWRGMHLDVSRHFFSPEMIKEYIDLMAAFKFNMFHWHLCDDNGWRLEIKKYPLLTSVGAWRAERPGKSWKEMEPTKEGEATTYGGFYTQKQVRDIVAYAKERNVTIVPEIEMPGHSAAALSAYPNLSCTQNPQPTLTGGIYPPGEQTNYCVGNDSVFTFLENVLTEVMQLFPSKYIHIGGDEVNTGSWIKCAKCQALKKRLGLKDENELQSYFIQRIGKFLASHHRILIGWDEILKGGLAPNAAVMSWGYKGESGCIAAARMHHTVVMTPEIPLYFDQFQEGYDGKQNDVGGPNSLKMVYEYDPIPKALPPDEDKYILGAQANVWTEDIPTVSRLEYMILPRMLALSEVVWSPKNLKDWNNFYQRLRYHFTKFGQKGFNYCPGNFAVSMQLKSQNGKLMITLSSEIPDAKIFYTMDGSKPDTTSHMYENPIQLDSSFNLKAVTVLNGKVMGNRPSIQNFVMDKAVGLAVNYEYKPDSNHLDDGPNALTDGMLGTLIEGMNWHGFVGKDLVATIDFGKETLIHTISLECLQNYRDGIFMPQFVKFEASSDGVNFTEIGIVNDRIPIDEKKPTITDFTLNFPLQKIKNVRISAKNLGALPPGHPDAGAPALLLADEIIAN